MQQPPSDAVLPLAALFLWVSMGLPFAVTALWRTELRLARLPFNAISAGCLVLGLLVNKGWIVWLLLAVYAAAAGTRANSMVLGQWLKIALAAMPPLQLLVWPVLASVSSEGIPSLHSAAADGNVDRIQKIVRQRTDVNARDNNGETALMHAAAGGRTNAIEALILLGADASLSGPRGQTALSIARRHRHPTCEALILRAVEESTTRPAPKIAA